MRVGWVKFSKEEEKLYTQSLFFGTFSGFTVGTFVFILTVLPAIPRKPPENLLEWMRILFVLFAILTAFGWLTSTAFAYLRHVSDKGRGPSLRFSRIAVAIFVTFPAVLTYAALVSLLVLIPFNDYFSQWLSPGALYSLGMMLVFPFVILFIAIVLPDSRPRKILNRSLRKIRRAIRTRISKKD